MANIFQDFATTANQLSTVEDNAMTIELKRSHSYVIVSVETFLFTVDEAQDNIDYEADLNLKYLSNTFNVSTDKITVSLTVPKTDLVYNSKYHVAIVVHHDNEIVTSHLSPVLVASHYAFVSPNITGTLQNTELIANNHIQVNQYENLTARLVIDPTAYDANLTALGMTGDFDSNFLKATCKAYRLVVTLNAELGTLLLAYNKNGQLGVITGNGTISKVGNNYEVSTDFRYTSDETWWLVWELELKQIIAGNTEYVTIQYLQKVTALSLSSDIQTTYLATEGYNSTPVQINTTTDQDTDFIAAVAKTGALDVPDVNLSVVVVDSQTGAVREDIAEVIEDFTAGNSTAFVKVNNTKLEKGKSYNLVTFIN